MAVYAVPDEAVGDQVMAALTTLEALVPDELASFLAEQPDLSPRAWPRYVGLLESLPRTATNKVLKRSLAAEGVTAGAGALWAREARERIYQSM